eukprot:TRINITY_DN1045_c0_g2_i1.p1 TRINITY_DN1045_c0_g2~~TRINITY_DN1045_c0_g2_i1.p1  ORF type:complete len:519 (+),score=230.89 TRINITY_DN1045_c0_g2_i1:55-1557(+)
MANSTVIDDDVIDSMLKDLGNALIASDVNVRLVMTMRKNLKDKLKLDEMPAGINKRKIIQQAVFEELCNLLDPGIKPFQPVKGVPNVIMFVGLQGSGKTTTVNKLAFHYKKKNWKSCVVCADTFRAGAFDQLKQNSIRSKIPFYGSSVEADPVKVAKDGVEQFKAEGYEIIIVDTSGRHKQESELFEEMLQVSNVVKPSNVIFVMDASIGQAAHDQATAFRDKVAVGSIIITKMDGHAKGGGALSAVAATQSPIVFIGTGEHVDDLEPFVTRTFVSKLLGMGDIQGLIKKIKENVPMDNQPELMNRISQGLFSLRDMYEQFQMIMKMGPIGQMMEMLPGMGNIMKQAQMNGMDSSAKLKSYLTIMDSMTDEELDDNKVLENKKTRDSRIARIARGSGTQIREVEEILVQFSHFEKMMKKAKGMKGLVGKNGQMNTRNLGQMQNMIPPALLKQMGGMGGLQNMMKGLGGGLGGLGNLGNLGGLGGLGGLENMMKGLGGGNQ